MLPDANVGARRPGSGRYCGGALFGDQLGVREGAGHEADVTTSYAPLASTKLHRVTERSVTLGHMDARLKDLREPHERLRWARMQWQEGRGIKPDATAAAESLGMKPHAYRAYERAPGSSKHTPLSHQKAIEFGRKYGVSWEWLMTGRGNPTDLGLAQLTPTERRLIDALREAPEARQTAVADAIEQLLKTG